MAEKDLPPGVPHGLAPLLLPDGRLDNIQLVEWMEGARKFSEKAGIVLGFSAAALEARLKRSRGFPTVGSLSKAYRAKRVSRQLENAAAAHKAVMRYIQAAANEFEVCWDPEMSVAEGGGANGIEWKPRR